MYSYLLQGKLNTSDWIIASNEEEARDKACRKYLCGNECIEVIQGMWVCVGVCVSVCVSVGVLFIHLITVKLLFIHTNAPEYSGI